MNVASACEACGGGAADAEQPIPWERGDRFRVCAACGAHVLAFTLAPDAWHALASRHGWWREPLRPPRYDFEGRARKLEDAGLLRRAPRPPRARDFRADLARLVDHCATRQILGSDDINALTRHPPSAVLAELERFSARSDPGFLACAVDVSGAVLGPVAADFVRGAFDPSAPGAPLARWAASAARCLPPEEAFERVRGVVESADPIRRGPLLEALGALKTRATLDWIEANAPSSLVVDSWGRAAAFSRLDWPRAARWLAAGRPHSLIALDALRVLAQPHLLGAAAPRLERPRPTRNEVADALERATALDDAPRPLQAARFVREHIGTLLN